jgi:hypothetical protein
MSIIGTILARLGWVRRQCTFSQGTGCDHEGHHLKGPSRFADCGRAIWFSDRSRFTLPVAVNFRNCRSVVESGSWGRKFALSCICLAQSGAG